MVKCLVVFLMLVSMGSSVFLQPPLYTKIEKDRQTQTQVHGLCVCWLCRGIGTVITHLGDGRSFL